MDHSLAQRYYLRFAAAYILGVGDNQNLPEFAQKQLDKFSEDELIQLFKWGKKRELKLHRFKRSMDLPRVQKVLGHLRGLSITQLLDIGTGRGVFLWPLLDAFPQLKVHSVDILEFRVRDLTYVQQGGISRLSPMLHSVSKLPFNDNQFEVTTALEVLEHIQDAPKAFAEICRVTKHTVIISVPSKPDDNPEHIHLFDKETFIQLFRENGITRVKFDSVLNHFIVLGFKS